MNFEVLFLFVTGVFGTENECKSLNLPKLNRHAIDDKCAMLDLAEIVQVDQIYLMCIERDYISAARNVIANWKFV